jgi:hypothetical protein
MAKNHDEGDVVLDKDGSPPNGRVGNVVTESDTETAGVQTYAYDDKRKLGITGAVFLILNKMIGTGSMFSGACFSPGPPAFPSVCHMPQPKGMEY